MYIHTQNVGASTWYVYHNMNQKSIVEVLIHNDGRLTKVKPNRVIHANDNITIIEFTTSQTGVANVLGPTSGTNSSVEQQPQPDLPPSLLRGFNPSDRSGSISLTDQNTTVNGSSGAVRSIVARASTGKYQFRVHYTGNDVGSLMPNGLEIGIATAAFQLDTQSLYNSLNGDKTTLSGVSAGSYQTTGEFANSTLPSRFIGTNMYPDMLRYGDTIDVLLDLDANEVDFRINGSSPYRVNVLIPPFKSWHVFFGTYGSSINDITFDFVGDTFTPDDDFVAWDADDNLEASNQPFLQSRVPFIGSNIQGLRRLNDMRPILRVDGNGSTKSIYGRSGSGKYQFRVFCEEEFLNSNIFNGQYIGIASATATDTDEPFSALEGDSVVIGYDAGQPPIATVMYSYADQTLPNRGMISGAHVERMNRSQILDVLLDLDLNRVTFIIRNDARDIFEVDGDIVYQHSLSIPSGITWHAYMNMVNNQANISIDTAGYRFAPEDGYTAWDTMDNNLGVEATEMQTLVPLQGLQNFGSARLSDNGKRSVVSRNDTVRSIQSHTGGGKYQFRIYNERGLSSQQSHLQWHGLGTENADTTQNPYNANQGDLISFARPTSSNGYRIVYKYAESQNMSSVSLFPESPQYTFSQILDVLLDLDNNTVTFRTIEIGETQVEGNLVYQQTVSIPANQTWFIHSYFANSLTETVYDTAGYRFTPDPGFEPWDTVSVPPIQLQGFDEDYRGAPLTFLTPYSFRSFGGTRSLLSRQLSNGGKYQIRIFMSRITGSVFPPNTFFGVANENVVVNDRPFDPNLGDAACFCANGTSTFRVQVEYNDLLGPNQGQTSSTLYPGTLSTDVTIDMKLDMDAGQITWTVLNGASYTDTAPFFAENWFIYFRSSNNIPGDIRFDLTGETFTPDPGFLPWEY